MPMQLSRVFSKQPKKDLRGEVRDWLSCRLLDQDVAQSEGFAGLDGEIFTDLNAFILIVHGRPVADAVCRTGDQVGKRDPAIGVGK